MDLTDRAVDAAADALTAHPLHLPKAVRGGQYKMHLSPNAIEAARDIARDTLTAALPHLAPTLPICPNCEGEHFTCGACGIMLDATVTSQPVVDREALTQLVAYCREREVYRGRDNEIGADTAYGDVADRIDAILALRAGSAK